MRCNRVSGVKLDASLLAANGYTTISLSATKIDSIDPNAFTGYTQVDRIVLSFNELTQIDLQAFSAANNLVFLDLSFNPIKEIINTNNVTQNKLTTLFMENISVESFNTNQLISAFPNLDTLSFRSRVLDELKPNQLVGWKNLRSLDIMVKNQKSLKAAHFNGVQNTIGLFRFVSSQLKSLDYNAFDGLSSLETLDLSNNSLSAIIGLRIPSLLEIVILKKNLLSSFRPTSKFLTTININQLDLAENRFYTFSTINFSIMPKLTKLTLSANPIVSPNYVFWQIQQTNALTWLEARNLSIDTIASNAFQNLPNLEFVDLAFNKISNIGLGAFNKLSKVANIILIGNKITTIDNSMFSGLNKLVEINLANNNIAQLDSAPFANMPSLEALNLSSNNLTSIDRNVFSGRNNLKYIGIDANKISFIAPGTFNNLTTLEFINLSSNGLTSLDSNMFVGCTNLKTIFLTNNSISADIISKLCPTSQCSVYS